MRGLILVSKIWTWLTDPYPKVLGFLMRSFFVFGFLGIFSMFVGMSGSLKSLEIERMFVFGSQLLVFYSSLSLALWTVVRLFGLVNPKLRFKKGDDELG